MKKSGLVFVVMRNMYDYLSLSFEGFKLKRDDDKLIVDRKFSGLLGIINSLHNSVSINKKIELPLKQLWYPFYFRVGALDDVDPKNIIFIFFEGNRLSYQKKYLDYLKRKYPSAGFVFRMVNSSNYISNEDIPFAANNYDAIITIDRSDSERFNLAYLPNTFWCDIKKIKAGEKSDVLFLGNNKGRLRDLVRIYDILEAQGMDCLFFIHEDDKKKRIERNGIKYISNMDYLTYLGYVMSTRCILELSLEEQNGSTLRASEALFFDKYLITNNVGIIQEPYYRREFIHIFRKADNLGEIKINDYVSYDDKSCIDHQLLFDMAAALTGKRE